VSEELSFVFADPFMQGGFRYSVFSYDLIFRHRSGADFVKNVINDFLGVQTFSENRQAAINSEVRWMMEHTKSDAGSRS